MNITLSNCVIS